MGDDVTPFQMARIPVRGGIGAALLIAVLIGTMLADVPMLRGPALGAIALGLLFGLGRIVWHHRQVALLASLPPRRAAGPLDL